MLVHKKEKNKLEGLIGTLVDDSLGAGTENFSYFEQEKSNKFLTKPRTSQMPFKFNGSIIEEFNGKILQQ